MRGTTAAVDVDDVAVPAADRLLAGTAPGRDIRPTRRRDAAGGRAPRPEGQVLTGGATPVPRRFELGYMMCRPTRPSSGWANAPGTVPITRKPSFW